MVPHLESLAWVECLVEPVCLQGRGGLMYHVVLEILTLVLGVGPGGVIDLDGVAASALACAGVETV